jgi:hypothetical protein
MMTKYFITALASLFFLQSIAQKKVTTASHSTLTGVILPLGSKLDKRFLIVNAAKILLELESKKVNTGLMAIEVFYLPPVSVSGFNADSLVSQLTTLGWNIIPVETDDKYVWLQKDNRSVITYFLMDEKQTELYFGEAGTQAGLSMGLTDQSLRFRAVLHDAGKVESVMNHHR